MRLNATNPNMWKRPRGRPYRQSAKSLQTGHLKLLEMWRFLAENDIPMETPLGMEEAFMKHYGLSRKQARSYAYLFYYLHPKGIEKDLPKDLDSEIMKRWEQKKPFPR